MTMRVVAGEVKQGDTNYQVYHERATTQGIRQKTDALLAQLSTYLQGYTTLIRNKRSENVVKNSFLQIILRFGHHAANSYFISDANVTCRSFLSEQSFNESKRKRLLTINELYNLLSRFFLYQQIPSCS